MVGIGRLTVGQRDTNIKKKTIEFIMTEVLNTPECRMGHWDNGIRKLCQHQPKT